MYFHCILVIVFSTNLLWNLINLTWFKLSYFFCQDYAEKPTFLNFSTTAFSQGQQLHFSLKNFYVCTLSLLSLSQKYKEESKDYFVIHARHGSKSNVSPTHSRIKKYSTEDQQYTDFLCLCCLSENLPLSNLTDRNFDIVVYGHQLSVWGAECHLFVVNKEPLLTTNKYKNALKMIKLSPYSA